MRKAVRRPRRQTDFGRSGRGTACRHLRPRSMRMTLTLALDVTSEDDMAQMASRTVERFGGIDTLVAAAGILRTGGEPRTVVDTSYDGVAHRHRGQSDRYFSEQPRGSGRHAGTRAPEISSIFPRPPAARDAPLMPLTRPPNSALLACRNLLRKRSAGAAFACRHFFRMRCRTSLWDQSGSTALKAAAHAVS